jgi:hypothetical protein
MLMKGDSPMKKTKLFAAVCVLFVMIGISAFALAQAQLDITREEKFSSYVEVPALSGLSDLSIQDSINGTIMRLGGFEGYTAILRSLSDESATGIQVKSQSEILTQGGQQLVLSLVIEASGRIGPGRPGHQITPMVFNLGNGQQVSAQDMFIDVADAAQALERMVEENFTPDLSSYLDAGALLPLPINSFSLDAAGVTFYYPSQQLTMLSGRSGAVNFHYDEIASLLNLEEGSLLWALGIMEKLGIHAGTKDEVAEYAGSGRLPGLPVRLGDNLSDVMTEYPLLMDSEAFPDGEKFYMEDARLRDTALIAEGGQDARIIGILSYRMNLAGILAGQTNRDQVLQALGEPASSLELDAQAADSYGLTQGKLDTFHFGDHDLALSYDGEKVLQAIWLIDRAQ